MPWKLAAIAGIICVLAIIPAGGKIPSQFIRPLPLIDRRTQPRHFWASYVKLALMGLLLIIVIGSAK